MSAHASAVLKAGGNTSTIADEVGRLGDMMTTRPAGRNLLATSLILAACLQLPAAADVPAHIQTARAHVAANAVFRESRPPFAAHAVQIAKLLQGRDAETKTTSFLHAIRRHANKLLTPEQSRRWSELLDSRQDEVKRLHDERNVLRGFFFAKAWELPLAHPDQREQLSKELNSWLAVWLEVTLHERIAHHRLCRDAWQILTPPQRAQLSRGDWDRNVRKSIGHQRAYFGDRIVSRALGKPARPEPFKTLSGRLAHEHIAIQNQLLAAERRWRILTFTQPPVPDALLAAEWHRTADALGAFFLNQADHIDQLVRTGYDLNDPAARQRVRQQPAAERATLAEKVRTKLTAGQALHAILSQ